jgi:drug/metabolite transporter (DMT)-like permease
METPPPILDMPTNPPMTWWSATQVTLLCTLFGVNAIAVKFAFQGFGVFSSASIRFGTAVLVIALWAMLTGRSFRLRPGQFRHLFVYSTLFAVQLSLFYIGLDRTYASRGTLLINLLPFIVLVLAHFFIPGDRVTPRKLMGLLLGFSGVVCVFSGHSDITGRARSGDIFILVATTLWACNIVYIKRIIDTFTAFHIVFYSMLLSFPFFSLAAFLFDAAAVKTLSIAAILALGYQTFVTASFGFMAWNHLLKRFGAVNLHSFVFIMPLVGVYGAHVVLDEPVTLRLVLALALIVAGLLVIHFNPPRRFSVLPKRGKT